MVRAHGCRLAPVHLWQVGLDPARLSRLSPLVQLLAEACVHGARRPRLLRETRFLLRGTVATAAAASATSVTSATANATTVMASIINPATHHASP